MSARLLLVLAVSALTALPSSSQDLWTDVEARALAPASRALPTAYRALALDRTAMDARLATAPAEVVPGALTGAVEIPLPLPDGTTPVFRLVESSIMEPGLQARYPQLRTYVGARADDPRTTVRLSATPLGVSAWIHGPDGLALVDPVGDFHMAYRRADAAAPEGWAEARRQEQVLGEHGEHEHEETSASRAAPGFSHGRTLRLYQLAVATTGEYAQFHGGTVESTMEAIVVAMTRVNFLYERDVAVRMLLIDDNERIVFTDPVTDPFNNNSAGALISQVQGVIDDSIGTDNYDIGHVFSTGGGGIANFGSVCRDDRKAQGVTGLPSPIGDPFYVDYVAHEIGHQFRGSHTFNGTAGACGGANRSPNTAFEPGSGSTIMAYAGICGGHNIQNNSDPYFHSGSLREIWSYVSRNAGRFCADEVATNNEPPVVTVSDTLYLPVSTPFALGGEATDETPDALTYVWEEANLGAGGAPAQRLGFLGRPPLFRSFNPTVEPLRTFPQPERLRQGLPPIVGEALPSRSEELEFRLTVRDNAPGAGAVTDAELLAIVEGSVGPFALTFPNEANLAFDLGSELAVTWDVAGTALVDADGNEDEDLVDIETVDVLLSRDNGVTFEVVAEGTPNDGAETITLPSDAVPRARLLVRATLDERGSLFFDLNDNSFSVEQIIVANEERPEAGGLVLGAPVPNPSRGTARLCVSAATPQTVTVALFDALGRRVRTLFSGAMPAGETRPVTVKTSELSPGAYVVRLVGETGVVSRPLTVLR
ncbi:MAG: reprolysin-like metallopeptidase [Bacteroidota bacterium]